MLLLDKEPRTLEAVTPIPDILPRYTSQAVDFIDFDGTLSDTAQVVERMGKAGEAFGINTAYIAAGRAEAHARDEAFEPYSFMQNKLSPDDFDAWFRTFKTQDDVNIMFNDGRTLLERERAKPSSPHLIMTYCPVPEWQVGKLWAAGFRGYAHIMNHTRKGPEIGSFINPETQRYELVGLSRRGAPLAVVETPLSRLIDDRLKYLRDAPQSCQQIYLDRKDENARQAKAELRGISRRITHLGALSVDNTFTPANRQAKKQGETPLHHIAAWVPLHLLVDYNPN